MRRLKLYFFITLILLATSVICENESGAATFNDAAIGNWNIGTTWGGACAASCTEGVDYPGPGDDAVIDSHTVSLSADHSVHDITISAGGTLDGNSYILTISGDWDSTGGSVPSGGNSWTAKFIGSGPNTITGSIAFVRLTIDTGADIRVDSNIGHRNLLTISGTLEISAGAQLFGSGGGPDITINATGIFKGAGTYGIFYYDGKNPVINGSIAIANFQLRAIWGVPNINIPLPAVRYGVDAPNGTDTFATDVLLYAHGDCTGHTFVPTTGTLQVDGNLTTAYSASCGQSLTVDNSTNNSPIIVGGNLIIGDSGGATTNTNTFITGDAYVTVSGDVIIYSSGSGDNIIDVSGMSGKTLSVAGNWTNSDTFTAGSSTVTFNSGSTGKTITSGSSSFYDIEFNNASGGWTLQDAMTAGNNFTITDSDTTGNGVDLNSQTIDVTGDFTLNGGKVTAGSSTLTVNGNWDSQAGTFNRDSSTVEFTGTCGSVCNIDAGSVRLYNTEIASGAIATLTSGSPLIFGDMTINGTLTINAGLRWPVVSGAANLNIGASGAISGAGEFRLTRGGVSTFPISTTGTIDVATFTYRVLNCNCGDAPPGIPLTSRTYGGALKVIAAGNNFEEYIYISGGDLVVGGDLWVGAGGWGDGSPGTTIRLWNEQENRNITIGGDLIIGENVDCAYFYAGSGNITVSGDVNIQDTSCGQATYDNTLDAGSANINVAGNWDSSGGTFTPGTGSVILTGTGNNIYTVASASAWQGRFNNLTINPGAYYSVQNSLAIVTDLTISGTLDVLSGNTVYQNWGDIIINPGGTLTGAGAFWERSFIPAWFNPVLSGTISIADFTYSLWWSSSGTPILIPAVTYGGNLTIANADGNEFAVLTGTGPLVVGGNLVIQDTYGYVQDIYGITLRNSDNDIDISVTGNLIVGNSSYVTNGNFITGNATITIGGNVRINNDSDGNNLDSIDSSDGTPTIIVGGDWTNNDTFTAGNSILLLNGSSDQSVTTGGDAFYNLTLNNTGASGNDDIIVNGLLDVNGVLTITDGVLELDTNDPNINTSGNVTIDINGSITNGTGTWTFDGITNFTDNSSGGPQNLGTVVAD